MELLSKEGIRKLMEKIWYIVRQTDHLGPYSYFELQDLELEKKIANDTQVWKDGLKSSVNFCDVQKVLDFEEKKKTLQLLPKPELKKNKEIELPAIPIDEELVPVVEIVAKKRIFSKKYFLLAALIPLLVGGKLVIEAKELIHFSLLRPNGIKKNDYERLAEISKNSFEEITLGFATSKDMSEIVMSTNFPYEGKVELTMVSIEDKMLKPEVVKVQSIAKLSGRMAIFNEFKYEAGTRILPGYYQMQIRLSDSVKRSYWLESFISLPKELSQSTVELISILPKSIFDKKLSEIKSQREKKSQMAWVSLHQRFLTIKSVMTQIQEEFEMLLSKEAKKKRWKEDLEKFTSKYEGYYGTFLGSFVKKDYRLIEGFELLDLKSKEELKSEFEKLGFIATDTATNSARILHELEQPGRGPSSKNVKRIKLQVKESFQELVEKANLSIAKIQSFI